MKYISIILSAIIMLSCGSKQEKVSETVNPIMENQLSLSQEQLKTFTLNTISLENKTINQTLKLNGSIDVPPQNLVSVSHALGGYIKSTIMLPGLHFKKGEVIAVLEDNQYIQLQQDYLTAKAQLQNALIEYNRQKELNASKASSDKVYQQAKTDYETLLISQKALEQKLRLININPDRVTVDNIVRTVNIYAPFTGYVTRVFVNTGKYVSPSDILFELVNPTDIHINLKVFEKDWDKLKTNQSLVAYTNSNPDKKYSGKLILIGKSITADRAVEVQAHIDNYDDSLIPGMYINADLDILNAKGHVIPDACIQVFEGKDYVFIQLDDNHFKLIPIEKGETGNGWVSINNYQILEGKRIVKDGAYTLLMSLKNENKE